MAETKESLTERFFSITTWKQLLITVVLGGFVLCAWLVYMNQGRVVSALEELVRRAPDPVVNTARIPEVTKQMLEDIPGVVSVTVWSMDMQANRRWLLGWTAIEPAQAFLQKWEARLKSGYPVLRIVPGSNVQIIEALNGGIGCGPLGGPEAEIAVMRQVNVVWECVAGIPPEAGQFAGAMYIGFSREVTKDQANMLRTPLWAAAQELAE